VLKQVLKTTYPHI